MTNPVEVANDIKTAILELADGRDYPDLLEAIDSLAALATPPAQEVQADFDRLAGRGIHELRTDELAEYAMSIANQPEHLGAVVAWMASEIERKTNDERLLAKKLADLRAAQEVQALQAGPSDAPLLPSAAQRAIQWVRDNYQDHTIDSLCEGLRTALAATPAAQPAPSDVAAWRRVKHWAAKIARLMDTKECATSSVSGWCHDAGERAIWIEDAADAALAATSAAQPVTQAGKYDNVLRPFVALMERELHANASKGDRPGWLAMSRDRGLLEIYWHVAKLSAAVKNDHSDGIREHSADVANMAMMLLDVCGGLIESPAAQPVAQASADFNAGIERAARWVEQRREDFDSEHGHTDPETGAFEYGTGPRAQAKEDYSNELYDIVEGIRALAQTRAEPTSRQ
ncbi:MAG: hypothetical protein EOO54_03750 [Haliea sp.]|nr:MAG: hypothetical protein EOO54_03750 [Haliea sp.]